MPQFRHGHSQICNIAVRPDERDVAVFSESRFNEIAEDPTSCFTGSIIDESTLQSSTRNCDCHQRRAGTSK